MFARLLVVTLTSALTFAVQAQTAWKPDKVVEIITSSAAGGSNDQIARVAQKILQDNKLLPTPLNIANKPGGNQTLAVVYLTQHPADAHFHLLANPTLYTNYLSAVTPLSHADLTPVALLLVEHTVISVPANSPIKTLPDLMARLKADPESVAVGIVSRGGPNHLALSQAIKAGGADPRRVRAAVFKTNTESMTAMAGGHLQLVASSVSSAIAQVQAGNARILAVASQRRLSGALANVPTFKEHGIDSWVSNWRAVFGAKGISPAHIAYWEETFAKMAATDDWKKQLEAHDWEGQFLRSREFSKYLQGEYAATRTIMTELGLVKIP
ncbi:MAG: tripartite tricarboxylate transporter substrate-binding protein [Burkholderiales bacterium]